MEKEKYNYILIIQKHNEDNIALLREQIIKIMSKVFIVNDVRFSPSDWWIRDFDKDFVYLDYRGKNRWPCLSGLKENYNNRIPTDFLFMNIEDVVKTINKDVDDKILNDNNVRENRNMVRNKALKKLSSEEIKALGL